MAIFGVWVFCCKLWIQYTTLILNLQNDRTLFCDETKKVNSFLWMTYNIWNLFLLQCRLSRIYGFTSTACSHPELRWPGDTLVSSCFSRVNPSRLCSNQQQSLASVSWVLNLVKCSFYKYGKHWNKYIKAGKTPPELLHPIKTWECSQSHSPPHHTSNCSTTKIEFLLNKRDTILGLFIVRPIYLRHIFCRLFSPRGKLCRSCY